VNGERLPVVEGTTNPVGVLLRGAAAPALLGLALLALIAVPFGSEEVLSSLVGGGMAVLALGVGPLIHQICRRLDPALSLGVAVTAYCTVIGLLWLGFSLLNDTSWLIGDFAAIGVVVSSVGWAAGHIRAALRLRQALYQHDETTAGR
jgi:hypothetical protein